MNGEQLYALYVLAMSEQNCGADAWADLSERDQRDWNRTAELVYEVLRK